MNTEVVKHKIKKYVYKLKHNDSQHKSDIYIQKLKYYFTCQSGGDRSRKEIIDAAMKRLEWDITKRQLDKGTMESLKIEHRVLKQKLTKMKIKEIEKRITDIKKKHNKTLQK